jgi:aspartyl-tRNA(Asn)/glutamyl-tRNA(Gln) amidotransferase subunit C
LRFKGKINKNVPNKLLFNKERIKVMTKINNEEVKKVAQLARLELNVNEINNHAEQLEKILEYIKQLEKINTDDVPCTTRAIEVTNVFRKDEKKNYDSTEEILELGPSREDQYFKVPKIINE